MKEAEVHTCRICGHPSGASSHIAVSKNYQVILCSGCGVYQTTPFPENIAGLYQNSYYSTEKSRRFALMFEWVIRWFRWQRARDIHRRYGTGRILDIGCGRGLMLYYLQRRFGWRVQGTQISETAHAYATRVLNCPVFLGDLLAMPLESEPYSVVTLYHVLEHLADPPAYLREISRRLSSHGACVIEVPNSASLLARWTKRHWFGWDVPHHIFHFDHESLTVLLRLHDFRVEEINHWSLEFNTFIVLQSLLNPLFSERDYFFALLQREARFSKNPFRATVCLCLGVALLPVAIIIALAGSMAGCGEIIRVYCRKVT
jgi:SAM-dependent methyltransferase